MKIKGDSPKCIAVAHAVARAVSIFNDLGSRATDALEQSNWYEERDRLQTAWKAFQDEFKGA